MKARAQAWTGWAMSILFVLFIVGASAAPKLAGAQVASDSMSALGWPAGDLRLIGTIELVCALLYAIPRTSLLGAVLGAGLLGGATATQMRAGMPLFSHVLFGFYLGLLMWGGLWLRSPALRALLPWRRETAG